MAECALQAYGALIVLIAARRGVEALRLQLCVDYNLTFAFLGNRPLIYRHLISVPGEQEQRKQKGECKGGKPHSA